MKETTYLSPRDHNKFFLVKNVTVNAILLFRGRDVTVRVFSLQKLRYTVIENRIERDGKGLTGAVSESDNSTLSRFCSYSEAVG